MTDDHPAPVETVLCDNSGAFTDEHPDGAPHPRMKYVQTDRDDTGTYHYFECPECGASGMVEETPTGGVKLWGVVTPRRLDMRQQDALAKQREGER
jgi:hypothetical protein